MTEDEREAVLRVDRLEAAAAQAHRRAVDARRLAMEIGRRQLLVERRDDASVGLHTPEVWQSSAASASREELRRSVGRSLWLASESLRETRSALEHEAARLEAASASHRRQAESAREWLQATRSVSSTSPAG